MKQLPTPRTFSVGEPVLLFAKSGCCPLRATIVEVDGGRQRATIQLRSPSGIPTGRQLSVPFSILGKDRRARHA